MKVGMFCLSPDGGVGVKQERILGADIPGQQRKGLYEVGFRGCWKPEIIAVSIRDPRAQGMTQ